MQPESGDRLRYGKIYDAELRLIGAAAHRAIAAAR